jgi:hypothetical protein
VKPAVRVLRIFICTYFLSVSRREPRGRRVVYDNYDFGPLIACRNRSSNQAVEMPTRAPSVRLNEKGLGISSQAYVRKQESD